MEYTYDILFACTTLSQKSTFVDFFNEIHQEINRFFPIYDVQKNAYFAYKILNQKESFILNDKYGYNLLVDNNYAFKTMSDNSIVELLKNNPNLRFDVIVFAQCSNLIQTISYNVYDITEKNLIFDNIMTFYNGLTDNGMIFNFYYLQQYDTSKLSKEMNKMYKQDMLKNVKSKKLNYPILNDFETFNSPYFFEYFDLFIFLVKVMNRLFKKISTGVYVKIPFEEKKVYKILEEEYDQTLYEMVEILKIMDFKQFLEEVNQRYYKDHPTLNNDKFNLRKFLKNKSISFDEEKIDIPEGAYF
jgi:hypothetical protein